MFRTLGLIWRSSPLRLASAALVLLGACIATLIPFQSLIAIEVLGFSDAGYALVLAFDAILGVTGAVWLGLITDSWLDRRTIAIGSSAIALVGTASMILVPSIPAFFLTHAIVYPLGGLLFSQVFALIRLASNDMPAEDRDSVLAAVRAFLAIPFLVVLPVWSAVLSGDRSLLIVYPAVLAFQGLLLAMVVRSWPSDKTAGWSTGKSDQSMLAGLKEITAGNIVIRVLIMGAITSGTPIYMAVLGLAFEGSPVRDRSDTALFFAFVAGLEVPVMLGMGWLLSLMSRRALIAVGTVCYAAFLIGLPLLLETPAVWILILPAAFGGGIILSLPLAYLQDLMSDRPGAGGALLAVQRVVSNGIAAAVFAVGTSLSGYGATAVIAGAGMILSAAAFLALERQKNPGPA